MLALLLMLAAALPVGVAEVRSVVAQVETAHRQGRLKEEHRVMSPGSIWPDDTTCDRWRNASGTVRRLTYAGGTSDSFTTLAQTYDAAGKLRFAFWCGGAVNQAQKEIRLYFDAAGWQLQRLAQETGPGYPFSDPAELLIFSVSAAAVAPC
ncbi:hypothetical protein FNU79_16765 [Deinococcus detaillensis]|uniref:Uncharacterized protein n=1 Tax=Deinococcus detaillensis TaxID=2592048 RepID=A0A553UJD9_9DEIO|nr:hypothetical protein [Deinococcus detaillensis]TSA80302.1 hypothetical protein FNU79_16765 [Deinococcus detaillensis]